MSPRPTPPRGRHAVRTALLVAVLLHTLAVLGVWATWGELGRGNVLAWIDFPASLAFMHLAGTPLIHWSLVAGGLQWAVIAALLATFLGVAARARRR